MEKQSSHLLFLHFFIVLLMGNKVLASTPKLFVFGDSYADTGNHRKPLIYSWNEPYGITFPGKPTGRFSDGRVSSDYLASFIGTRSPIPYHWRKINGKLLRYGINFAYGGTGVFDTLLVAPNITTQIDLLQHQIDNGIYSKADLQSSIAYLSIAGNDYNTYRVHTNGTLQNAPKFIFSVINQLAVDLNRLSKMGVKKIAITGLMPMGCLPAFTENSAHHSCNTTFNEVAVFHNYLLKKAVQELNQNNTGSTFAILDLYTAFHSILKRHGNQAVRWKFENGLKPCCKGISSKYSCGDIDGKGQKLYTVCERPESAFFWDSVHPTQQGWAAITAYLKTSFLKLYIS